MNWGNVTAEMMGNENIVKLKKVAFMNSRSTSISSVLDSLNWAVKMHRVPDCVIGGFHSHIEKNVLRILLKGTQPLIMVLARGFYRRMQPEIRQRLDAGNLLIISPFDASVTRVTPQTCEIRNRLIVELADRLVVGYVSPGGQLAKLLAETDKPVEYLDV